MRFGHFNYINHVRGIGSTPARVNRKTGELQINLDVWPKLKPEHKLFVLLHEEGHRALNTSNELAVDAYAFKKYAEAGYSLTEGVKALTQVLSGISPEHGLRAYLQLERAKEFDYYHNNNEKAKQNFYHNPTTLNSSIMFNTFMDDIQDGVETSYTGNGYDSLLGIAIGKKAKAKKQVRVEARQEKKAARVKARTERKAARTQNILSKASARTTLAAQGIKSDGGADIARSIGQSLSGIGNIAGQVTGAGIVQQQVQGAVEQQTTDAAGAYQARFPSLATQPYAAQQYGQQYPDAPLTDEQQKKQKTMFMIIGGVVLAVIVVAVFLMRTKTTK